MAIKLSSVPGPLVLALCVCAFFAGRFVQQGSQLPEPATLEVPSGERTVQSHRRSMSEAKAGDSGSALIAAQPKVIIKEVVKQLPAIDPLDPAQFETFALEQSGLNRIRPPQVPGATGYPNYHVIPFQILSWFPRVVVYPAFVDKARCEHVIALAKKALYPSGLAYRPGEAGDASQQTRTSSGTFLSSTSDTDGVLSWIEERIAAATLLPTGNGEAFNVLRYENDQHYDSHYDTFDPKDFGPQPSQRIATVLVYLSEVEAGGETVFKREGQDGAKRIIQDWRNCTDGSFKYTPRQGDAVLFWGVTPSGDIDEHALHGGCPVKKGEKWVATKWIRSKGSAY